MSTQATPPSGGSTEGDFLRSQMHNVTTFNECLQVVAEAFDGATVSETAAKETDDDGDTNDDDNGEPATRSRSPAQKKKVVKRKAPRRRYY